LAAFIALALACAGCVSPLQISDRPLAEIVADDNWQGIERLPSSWCGSIRLAGRFGSAAEGPSIFAEEESVTLDAIMAFAEEGESSLWIGEYSSGWTQWGVTEDYRHIQKLPGVDELSVCSELQQVKELLGEPVTGTSGFSMKDGDGNAVDYFHLHWRVFTLANEDAINLMAVHVLARTTSARPQESTVEGMTVRAGTAKKQSQ